MVEFFKHIYDLVFDKTKSWGVKTAATISIIGFLFLADLLFNFTYNIFINNKINQLEKIQTLKNSYKTDSLSLAKILLIEKKVLNGEHYADLIFRNLSNFTFKFDVKKGKEVQKPKVEIIEKPIRSIFWMALSSNYFFALILPFLLFIPLFGKGARHLNALLGWFSTLIMIGVVGSITTWISYQIPLILGNPIYNYVLNFFIHSIFWVIVFKLSKKSNIETEAAQLA
jgi:hypothetical protein